LQISHYMKQHKELSCFSGWIPSFAGNEFKPRDSVFSS